MDQSCRDEIVELHVFIEGWLSGQLPKTEADYARFRDALAESFQIVSPRGVVTERADLLREFWNGHGVHADEDFRVEIRNMDIRVAAGDVRVVAYEEWQSTAGTWTARISTVVFGPDEAAANGVRWLHLHETWMPGRVPAG